MNNIKNPGIIFRLIIVVPSILLVSILWIMLGMFSVPALGRVLRDTGKRILNEQ